MSVKQTSEAVIATKSGGLYWVTTFVASLMQDVMICVGDFPVSELIYEIKGKRLYHMMYFSKEYFEKHQMVSLAGGKGFDYGTNLEVPSVAIQCDLDVPNNRYLLRVVTNLGVYITAYGSPTEKMSYHNPAMQQIPKVNYGNVALPEGVARPPMKCKHELEPSLKSPKKCKNCGEKFSDWACDHIWLGGKNKTLSCMLCDKVYDQCILEHTLPNGWHAEVIGLDHGHLLMWCNDHLHMITNSGKVFLLNTTIGVINGCIGYSAMDLIKCSLQSDTLVKFTANSSNLDIKSNLTDNAKMSFKKLSSDLLAKWGGKSSVTSAIIGTKTQSKGLVTDFLANIDNMGIQTKHLVEADYDVIGLSDGKIVVMVNGQLISVTNDGTVAFPQENTKLKYHVGVVYGVANPSESEVIQQALNLNMPVMFSAVECSHNNWVASEKDGLYRCENCSSTKSEAYANMPDEYAKNYLEDQQANCVHVWGDQGKDGGLLCAKCDLVYENEIVSWDLIKDKNYEVVGVGQKYPLVYVNNKLGIANNTGMIFIYGKSKVESYNVYEGHLTDGPAAIVLHALNNELAVKFHTFTPVDYHKAPLESATDCTHVWVGKEDVAKPVCKMCGLIMSDEQYAGDWTKNWEPQKCDHEWKYNENMLKPICKLCGEYMPDDLYYGTKIGACQHEWADSLKTGDPVCVKCGVPKNCPHNWCKVFTDGHTAICKVCGATSLAIPPQHECPSSGNSDGSHNWTCVDVDANSDGIHYCLNCGQSWHPHYEDYIYAGGLSNEDCQHYWVKINPVGYVAMCTKCKATSLSVPPPGNPGLCEHDWVECKDAFHNAHECSKCQAAFYPNYDKHIYVESEEIDCKHKWVILSKYRAVCEYCEKVVMIHCDHDFVDALHDPESYCSKCGVYKGNTLP